MNGSIVKSKVEKRKRPDQPIVKTNMDKAKKAPTKADIVIQLRALRENHEALEVENK